MLALVPAAGPCAPVPSFSDVAALLEGHCVVCHGGEGAPLGLRLDSHEGILSGSERAPVIVAGKPPQLPWLDMNAAIKHCAAGVGISGLR